MSGFVEFQAQAFLAPFFYDKISAQTARRSGRHIQTFRRFIQQFTRRDLGGRMVGFTEEQPGRQFASVPGDQLEHIMVLVEPAARGRRRHRREPERKFRQHQIGRRPGGNLLGGEIFPVGGEQQSVFAVAGRAKTVKNLGRRKWTESLQRKFDLKGRILAGGQRNPAHEELFSGQQHNGLRPGRGGCRLGGS